MRRREMSLARQYLALQLLIVLTVLVIVPAISLAQSEEEVRRVEGRRALSAAENLAANPTVRTRLPVAQPRTDRALAAVGETTRTVSGASDVLLARRDRTVVTSSDPSLSRPEARRRRQHGAGRRGLDRGHRPRRPGVGGRARAGAEDEQRRADRRSP